MNKNIIYEQSRYKESNGIPSWKFLKDEEYKLKYSESNFSKDIRFHI